MSRAGSALSGLRLLVVEDEFLIAEHIEDQLDSIGCEVAGPVATIEEALAAIKGEVLHGALLDANLNGNSSAPVAAALLDSGIPFVVVTGYGGCTLPDRALDRAPRLNQTFQ